MKKFSSNFIGNVLQLIGMIITIALAFHQLSLDVAVVKEKTNAIEVRLSNIERRMDGKLAKKDDDYSLNLN